MSEVTQKYPSFTITINFTAQDDFIALAIQKRIEQVISANVNFAGWDIESDGTEPVACLVNIELFKDLKRFLKSFQG